MLRQWKPTLLVAGAVLALTACGGSSEETAPAVKPSSAATVTLTSGEVMTEPAFQQHVRALIADVGYASVCRQHAPTMEDDLGKSTVDDRKRIIALWQDVCAQHAASIR